MSGQGKEPMDDAEVARVLFNVAADLTHVKALMNQLILDVQPGTEHELHASIRAKESQIALTMSDIRRQARTLPLHDLDKPKQASSRQHVSLRYAQSPLHLPSPLGVRLACRSSVVSSCDASRSMELAHSQRLALCGSIRDDDVDAHLIPLMPHVNDLAALMASIGSRTGLAATLVTCVEVVGDHCVHRDAVWGMVLRCEGAFKLRVGFCPRMMRQHGRVWPKEATFLACDDDISAYESDIRLHQRASIVAAEAIQHFRTIAPVSALYQLCLWASNYKEGGPCEGCGSHLHYESEYWNALSCDMRAFDTGKPWHSPCAAAHRMG